MTSQTDQVISLLNDMATGLRSKPGTERINELVRECFDAMVQAGEEPDHAQAMIMNVTAILSPLVETTNWGITRAEPKDPELAEVGFEAFRAARKLAT